MNSRHVFFISDSTGITAETLGNSLISQFEGVIFKKTTLPFVDNAEKIQDAKARIHTAQENDGEPAIVLGTIMTESIRKEIQSTNCIYLDFMHAFIGPLEQALKTPSTHSIGKTHAISDWKTYHTRIDAVNYALRYDDGAAIDGFQGADIILIGVSRSGKTPTCLYLAMHYGIRAANYPLLSEDLDSGRLPQLLQPYRQKLLGLTIDPARLMMIREKRRPNSDYASASRCLQEVKQVEQLYRDEQVPFLSSTGSSIEEMAARIIDIKSLDRRLT